MKDGKEFASEMVWLTAERGVKAGEVPVEVRRAVLTSSIEEGLPPCEAVSRLAFAIELRDVALGHALDLGLDGSGAWLAAERAAEDMLDIGRTPAEAFDAARTGYVATVTARAVRESGETDLATSSVRLAASGCAERGFLQGVPEAKAARTVRGELRSSVSLVEIAVSASMHAVESHAMRLAAQAEPLLPATRAAGRRTLAALGVSLTAIRDTAADAAARHIRECGLAGRASGQSDVTAKAVAAAAEAVISDVDAAMTKWLGEVRLIIAAERGQAEADRVIERFGRGNASEAAARCLRGVSPREMADEIIAGATEATGSARIPERHRSAGLRL